MCIIIGDVHQFIGQCLIPLDAWFKMLCLGQKDLVGRQERIDALDLLGATFVDKKRDMLGALNLWKRAIEER